MTASVIRTTKTISELSLRTLAAGQAKIDQHASGHMAQLAEQQSLRVIHAAHADLAQRACERWLELLYEREGETWWNVRDDGMIRLAPPWSRSRRRSYGLTEPQARLLLRITRDLIQQLPERRQLYWYMPKMQRYALNRSRFPTAASALDWQRTVGAIKATMWHTYATKYPGGRL